MIRNDFLDSSSIANSAWSSFNWNANEQAWTWARVWLNKLASGHVLLIK